MRLCLALAALLLISAGPPPGRLQARAPAGRTLTLLAARGKQAWTVTVAETGQRITAAAEGDVLPDAPPLLMPLVRPQIDDLLLPVLLGMVNLEWDVFLQDPGSGRFMDAGRLSGIGVARDRSGVIVTLARSSCCEWAKSAWRIGPDRQLEKVLEIDMPLDEQGRITACTSTRLNGGRPDPGLLARLCAIGKEPTLAAAGDAK